MSSAHALALALIPFATVGAAVAAMIFRWVRDVFFCAIVGGAIMSERMDVHFVSMEWYRGTTRGFEISLIAILAFAVLVGCIFGRNAHRPRIYWPASLAPLLLYAFYAVFSVCISPPRLFGAFELTKLVETIIVFLAAASYLRTKREWTLLLVMLAIATSIEGAWAIKQKLITKVERPPGSLDHANSLSMYLCMVGPLMIAGAYRSWKPWLRWACGAATFFATVGVVLTLSRTGVPVFALCALGCTLCCASFVPTPKRLMLVGATGAAIVGVFIASWSHLKERYLSASLDEEYLDTSEEGRGVYFRLAGAILRDHPMGVGLNNWSYYVSRQYGPEIGFRYADYDYLLKVYGPSDDVFADSYLPAPAHNLGVLTVGELGIPGLVLFLILWGRWLTMGFPCLFKARRSAAAVMGAGIFFSVCGIFGQSLTEWVYRQTPILFTFYILMGALAAIVHARRTHPEEV